MESCDPPSHKLPEESFEPLGMNELDGVGLESTIKIVDCFMGSISVNNKNDTHGYMVGTIFKNDTSLKIKIKEAGECTGFKEGSPVTVSDRLVANNSVLSLSIELMKHIEERKGEKKRIGCSPRSHKITNGQAQKWKHRINFGEEAQAIEMIYVRVLLSIV
ncbi:hypothetical protein M3Y98_00608100 [Aphelenchoides besseyi]|nr:hypothetical protein M3Y98_00608100 [Aphelenchoides besseyi]